ncbi:hypothetical protein BX600DRAFT_384988, partial [Xylariales sp. PMI_506]
FFRLKSLAMRMSVAEMERQGFPFFTEIGLDFCKQRNTILDYFQQQRCVLGHWLRYKAYPGHIVCFRKGGPRAGKKALMVHVWAKGSRASYWRASHLHDQFCSPHADEVYLRLKYGFVSRSMSYERPHIG